MKPCAEVIFNKGVAYSKLIDAYRLETVIYILKEVRKKSYSSEKELEENGNLSQEGIQMVAKQKECDKEYNQKMQTIRKGRSGEYTRELWIDRRENSKSLAWSSVLLALGNVKEVGAVVDRPKALGDIRGVTYIYGMFYRFGLIDVPDDAKRKMNKNGCVSKG